MQMNYYPINSMGCKYTSRSETSFPRKRESRQGGVDATVGGTPPQPLDSRLRGNDVSEAGKQKGAEHEITRGRCV